MDITINKTRAQICPALKGSMMTNGEKSTAIDMLAALSDPDRLDVFVLLRDTGPEGLTAAEIDTRLKYSSFRLATALRWLHRANVISGPVGSNTGRIHVNYKALTLLGSLFCESKSDKRGN